MALARVGLSSTVCIVLDPRIPYTDLGAGRALVAAEDAVGAGSLAAKGADSEELVQLNSEAILDDESNWSGPNTEADGNLAEADLGTVSDGDVAEEHAQDHRSSTDGLLEDVRV